MTAADQNLVIRVLDAPTEMGPIDTRPYFGGTAFVADGHQFAFAMGNELYIAVDDRTRPQVEAFGAELCGDGIDQLLALARACACQPDEDGEGGPLPTLGDAGNANGNNRSGSGQLTAWL